MFCFTLGFQWQRQLVFRSKLTMHTAYDRKDNTEPASITCISISKYVNNKIAYMQYHSYSWYFYTEITGQYILVMPEDEFLHGM